MGSTAFGAPQTGGFTVEVNGTPLASSVADQIKANRDHNVNAVLPSQKFFDPLYRFRHLAFHLNWLPSDAYPRIDDPECAPEVPIAIATQTLF
jgi:hypothetical protein